MKDFYHPEFRFNNQQIAFEDLNDVAYSLIKEGAPFEKAAGDFLMDWIDSRPDIIQRTSGSTGSPREISLQKSSMVQSAQLTGKTLDLGPGSRVLCPLSLTTIAGKMMMVRAMVLGWQLHVQEPGADPLARSEGHFDFAAMVPLQLTKSLERLHRLRSLIVGGAPIPAGTLAALPADKTNIWQTYGMTETCSHIALRKLGPVPAGADPEEVLPPFQVLEGIEVSQDERGCLVVRAPGLLKEALTTNDLVRMESDRTFRWLGRMDRIVNSGGVKLHPEVLEARLGSLVPGRFFLAGLSDPELGEKLTLVVEGMPDTKKLREAIRASGVLDAYEVPKEILPTPSFEQTDSGKVDRRATLAKIQS